jgi:hypothetical protein
MACNPNSGSSFPVGNNTVTCRAVDAAGNRGTASFTLSVVSTAPEDTIPPVIQEPNILPSRSPAGATTYTVVATDNFDGTATLGEYDEYPTQDNVGGGMYLRCNPSSGSVFSAGDNLRCGAYDSSGNAVITTFTVPTVGVPQAATLNATASNATTPSLSMPSTPSSPSTSPDTAPPTVTVPNNMEVETTDPTGGTSSVTYNNVRAVDNVDGEAVLEESDTITQDNVGGSITIACDPPSGSTFPVGVTTTVQCNAYDAAGNVGIASFTVTVTSTTPPPQTLQAENTTTATTDDDEDDTTPPAGTTDGGGGAGLPGGEGGGTTEGGGGDAGDTDNGDQSPPPAGGGGGGDGGDDTEDGGGGEPPATTTDEGGEAAATSPPANGEGGE